MDAVNEFRILDGEHVVVSAPTSAGKTMIGELAALKGALDRKRAMFLLPLKALVNDKFRYFEETYGPLGIRTIEATGDTDDITALIKGQYDISLLTYEKFASIVLAYPHVLDEVGTIVIDEVQMVADDSRGANLEFILTLLRMRRTHGTSPQLIALSAVIGDTNGLERWLGARLLRREERPVPLDEGVLLADGRFRFINTSLGKEQTIGPIIRRQPTGKNSNQDWVIPLLRKLVSEGKQVIVFRERKVEAVACAKYLARELGLPPASVALDSLPTGDLSKASQDLRAALQGGIAFHNSDLERDERHVIEERFRAPDTTLRVIAATTTLAMGVNTPASAVVIVGLNHPGPKGSKIPYTVAEYKNLAGRAGRLSHSETGASFLLALNAREVHQKWQHYIVGSPEDLKSRFLDVSTDPRSLIVRVLAATQRAARRSLSADEIVDFLESSFGAFQQIQMSQQWKWNRSQLMQAIQSLDQHSLIDKDQDGQYQLAPLGRLAGEGGVEVESIVRLVDCLRPLNLAELNDPALVTAAQITAELDDQLFPLNYKSTKQEPTFWISELRYQNVPSGVLAALRRSVSDEHTATLRAKKAVSCLLFITARELVEIEKTLTQFHYQKDAAGAIRNVASRTCDLLTTVCSVAEILHPELNLENRKIRLLHRLSLGVPVEGVELAIQAGTRLTRGDYMRLLASGLCRMEVIERTGDAVLLDCLDGNAQKLVVVRKAVESYREQKSQQAIKQPILEPYKG
jgi:replicative superfamily II helicase